MTVACRFRVLSLRAYELVNERPRDEASVTGCGRWPAWASSVLAPVEVGLAVRRANAPTDVVARADRVLGSLDLVPLDPDIADWARREAPTTLRALDAIHLGSALALAADLGALLTYDRRLADAARDAGIVTLPRR